MRGAVRAEHQQCRVRQGEGNIRIVLLEDNLAVRRRLQDVIAEDPAFVVVGYAELWDQCEPLLEEHLPELLIARAALLPPGVDFEASGLPIVLRPRATSDSDQPEVDCTPQEFRNQLLRVRQELYSRKACELSLLLDHYLEGLHSFSHLSTLKACHAGEGIEIPVSQIRMIEASGNYARIYAYGKVYTLRETLSCLQAKLDPGIFLRVHRSYLVNRRWISHLASAENGASLLVFDDGNTIPIGPNYRDQVERLFESGDELVA
jgi:LytTr DNA-binding domain